MPNNDRKLMSLVFPSGGLNSKYAYQDQSPYTTPDCLNVRPSCVIKGRERGGSRPGLNKAFYDLLGSGNPVRMLGTIDVVQETGLQYFSDSFMGTDLGANWTAASWIGTLPDLWEEGQVITTYNSNVGAVGTAITDLNTSSRYAVEVYIEPYMGEHCGTYKLFARMNDTTPVATTDGLIASLTMLGASGAFTGSLISYNASTPTAYSFTAGTDSFAAPGWFRMLITGTNVKCYWNGNLLVNQTVSLGASAGTRMGFGMTCSAEFGLTVVSQYRNQYYSTAFNRETRRMLCASSNGTLYYTDLIGTLTALSSNYSLNSDRHIDCCERLQKLYIADRGSPKAYATDGVLVDTSLDSATYTDWTTIGANIYDYVAVITAGTGTVVNGVYAIATIASGNLTLASSAGTGNCTFSIERCPKIYDPSANTLTRLMADGGKGSVPVGSRLICVYRDRLIFAKDNIYYMSRQSVVTDWDYSATDSQRAFLGQASTGGDIGEVITALLPFGDDYLLIACKNSIWVLRGDPGYGGQCDNLTRSLGILSETSVCHGIGGDVWFLSSGGLGYIASVASVPQMVSVEKIPQELINVDPNSFDILMQYDIQNNGIHLFLTPKTTVKGSHWWIDLSDKEYGATFWPLDIPATYQPCSILDYHSYYAPESAVVLGCKDGYVRKFDPSTASDGGTEIDSYVVYGPLNPAKSRNIGYDRKSKLMEMTGTLAQYSGDVTWKLYSGESAEATLQNTHVATGKWTTFSHGGKNYKSRPGMKQSWFALKLENYEANHAWAIEGITAIFEKKGIDRLP